MSTYNPLPSLTLIKKLKVEHSFQDQLMSSICSRMKSYLQRKSPIKSILTMKTINFKISKK